MGTQRADVPGWLAPPPARRAGGWPVMVTPDGLEVARELIPAAVRRRVYAAGSLAGYGLAAVSVGFVTAGSDVPSWVAVALAVLGSLMGPLGQLAATNVAAPDSAPEAVEPVLLPAGDDPAIADDEV